MTNEKWLCKYIKGDHKGETLILTTEQLIHPYYKKRVKVIKKIKQTPEVLKK